MPLSVSVLDTRLSGDPSLRRDAVKHLMFHLHHTRRVYHEVSPARMDRIYSICEITLFHLISVDGQLGIEVFLYEIAADCEYAHWLIWCLEENRVRLPVQVTISKQWNWLLLSMPPVFIVFVRTRDVDSLGSVSILPESSTHFLYQLTQDLMEPLIRRAQRYTQCI